MMRASVAKQEYTSRLDASRIAARRWGQRERWLSNLRLLVFALGLAVAWFSFGTHVVSARWLAGIAAGFVLLVIVHDRAIRCRSGHQRRGGFYERGMARLEDRWAGTGETGEQYRDSGHPYAEDLDLFGKGSIFELLCTARTPAGERTLAKWLLAPAGVAEVRERQHAVEELRERLELREDLALLGDEVRARLDPQAMIRWGERRVRLVSRGVRVGAAALSTASVACLTAWLVGVVGPLPLLTVLLVQGGFALGLRQRVRGIINSVERPTRDLRLLSGLLARLEREPFESPRLVALRAALDTQGRPPSKGIVKLQRLVDLVDARRNQLFAPLAGLLLWSTQIALAIEAWRAQWGAQLRTWIGAAGEIEALCALSGYAYEHPRDPFPEVVESGPLLEARGMGHVLIPDERCVRNDLLLGGQQRALVVSGSNMSGKSTLLRSAGSNAVLALAGAPVRADSLRLSPLAVAASIRVNDSLQEGTSRFYAEITRLRQILGLAEGSPPVLFLLDEVLHGTNSHDRRVGALGVVRGLVGRGALGLVTTHDLALAKIADELAPRVTNVHFEDHLEDGRIRFEYRLRRGVVRRSNALELMRAVGLEV